MLEDSKAYSGFAVDDVGKAKRFYGETLGLKVTDGPVEHVVEIHLHGDRPVLVYEKPGFEPASFTILNFPVEDVEAAVEELGSRGVRFERYEGFDQDERGIDRNGPGGGIAWFKDPAGNILAVHGQP